MGSFGDGGIQTIYFYTGIRVRDLERSVQFYRKVMGMKVTRRGRMHHGGVWVELKSPASPQRLELNWYPAGSQYFTPYRRGEELDHLSFRVSDVHRAFKEIVAKGARPEIEPFREDRYEFAFASDPDGIWIELLGRIKA
jgi:lactoylglutathione lyase